MSNLNKLRDKLDVLQANADCERSYCFGQTVGYNEISMFLDILNSKRSLVMKLNERIREAEDIRANANDDEDYQTYTGEIDAYKTFKELLKKK